MKKTEQKNRKKKKAILGCLFGILGAGAVTAAVLVPLKCCSKKDERKSEHGFTTEKETYKVADGSITLTIECDQGDVHTLTNVKLHVGGKTFVAPETSYSMVDGKVSVTFKGVNVEKTDKNAYIEFKFEGTGTGSPEKINVVIEVPAAQSITVKYKDGNMPTTWNVNDELAIANISVINAQGQSVGDVTYSFDTTYMEWNQGKTAIIFKSPTETSSTTQFTITPADKTYESKTFDFTINPDVPTADKLWEGEISYFEDLENGDDGVLYAAMDPDTKEYYAETIEASDESSEIWYEVSFELDESQPAVDDYYYGPMILGQDSYSNSEEYMEYVPGSLSFTIGGEKRDFSMIDGEIPAIKGKSDDGGKTFTMRFKAAKSFEECNFMCPFSAMPEEVWTQFDTYDQGGVTGMKSTNASVTLKPQKQYISTSTFVTQEQTPDYVNVAFKISNTTKALKDEDIADGGYAEIGESVLNYHYNSDDGYFYCGSFDGDNFVPQTFAKTDLNGETFNFLVDYINESVTFEKAVFDIKYVETAQPSITTFTISNINVQQNEDDLTKFDLWFDIAADSDDHTLNDATLYDSEGNAISSATTLDEVGTTPRTYSLELINGNPTETLTNCYIKAKVDEEAEEKQIGETFDVEPCPVVAPTFKDFEYGDKVVDYLPGYHSTNQVNVDENETFTTEGLVANNVPTEGNPKIGFAIADTGSEEEPFPLYPSDLSNIEITVDGEQITPDQITLKDYYFVLNLEKTAYEGKSIGFTALSSTSIQGAVFFMVYGTWE